MLDSFEAVLFDFDGTLADSFGPIAASVNHVRAKRGLEPLAVEAVKRHVGHGPEHLLRNTVPGGDVDEDLKTYRAHHPSVMRDGTRLLPGAKDVLTWLFDRRKRIGLCSNKPRLFSQELLVSLGVREWFHLVLGPEDVVSPKPAPDMLQKALRVLELPAEKVLYVGDMTVDIQTARSAGLTVWVVPTGSETRESLLQAQPDFFLESLAAMLPSVNIPGSRNGNR